MVLSMVVLAAASQAASRVLGTDEDNDRAKDRGATDIPQLPSADAIRQYELNQQLDQCIRGAYAFFREELVIDAERLRLVILSGTAKSRVPATLAQGTRLADALEELLLLEALPSSSGNINQGEAAESAVDDNARNSGSLQPWDFEAAIKAVLLCAQQLTQAGIELPALEFSAATGDARSTIAARGGS
eukprot:COSAG01_NODE_20681_length_940_cov_2.441141_1_plen_188_part_00